MSSAYPPCSSQHVVPDGELCPEHVEAARIFDEVRTSRIVSAREGAYLLRKRAGSYASDAEALRIHGNTEDAPPYEVIARELRAAAELLEALTRRQFLPGPSAANTTAGAIGTP